MLIFCCMTELHKEQLLAAGGAVMHMPAPPIHGSHWRKQEVSEALRKENWEWEHTCSMHLRRFSSFHHKLNHIPCFIAIVETLE